MKYAKLPTTFLLVLLLTAIPALIWPQASVNQVDGPPSGSPVQTVYVLSGTTTIAICWSPSIVTPAQPVTLSRNLTSVAIASVSKANPAVVTSTGHGFTVGTRPNIVISGATGTGWTAINAGFVATVIDANTFSIPIDSSGFGTLAGTVTFKTTAPRQGIAEWAVQLINYTAGNVTSKTWIGGSNAFSSKCSDATSTSVNMQ